MILCFGANGAELRGPERKLCNNGFTANGSSCITYARGSCSSGNVMIDSSRSSFKATSGGTCSGTAYTLVTLPVPFEILNSYVHGPTRKLCTNGYTPNGSSCYTYKQGECASGNRMIDMPRTSLKSTLANGTCANGLVSETLPANFEILNSYTMGPTRKLCTNGHTSNSNGTTCSAYPATNCPSNYRNMNGDAGTFAMQSDGACPDNTYALNTDFDACKSGANPAACIDFCNGSGWLTGLGTCASLCGAGVTTMRASNGLILPLWATKQITPSLNFKIGNNVCYVNVVPGQTNGHGLVLNDNGIQYHTLEWEMLQE